MAKTGPARPGSQQHTTPEDPDQIDTQIENLTVEVAKAAKINSTPIFIGLIVVITLITLPSIFDSMKERQIQQWNNEIDTTLTGEADQVRLAYPRLLQDVAGQTVESLAIGRVARWLWDQETNEDRQQAVTLLEESQSRLPDDPLISSYLVEFSTSRENSLGFVLPVIPEPVIPEPVIPEPVIPEPVIPEPVIPEPVIPEPAPTTDATAKPTLTTDATAKPTLTTDATAKPTLTTDATAKPTLTTDDPVPPAADPPAPDATTDPTESAGDLGPPAPAAGGGGN